MSTFLQDNFCRQAARMWRKRTFQTMPLRQFPAPQVHLVLVERKSQTASACRHSLTHVRTRKFYTPANIDELPFITPVLREKPACSKPAHCLMLVQFRGISRYFVLVKGIFKLF